MGERQVVGTALPNIGIPVIGCLAVLLSLLILIDKPSSIATPLLMAAGSFIVIFSVAQGIYHPVPYEVREGEILYGVFVTWAGAIITITNSILSAFYVKTIKTPIILYFSHSASSNPSVGCTHCYVLMKNFAISSRDDKRK
jgi:hypothetical protein